MNASANAFAAARDMFRDYTGYTKPLTYEEFEELPHDHKAAVLFVQFYDQITLAWFKCKSLYADDENGVSTMLQYLMKQVNPDKKTGQPVLTKARFNAKYIYRVAYNCLYCICHDIKADKERFAIERSNILQVGDTEVDLFDTTVQDAEIEETLLSRDFWRLIDEHVHTAYKKFDPEDRKRKEDELYFVINNLLGADCPLAVLDMSDRHHDMLDADTIASMKKAGKTISPVMGMTTVNGKIMHRITPERKEECIKELQGCLFKIREAYLV